MTIPPHAAYVGVAAEEGVVLLLIVGCDFALFRNIIAARFRPFFAD